MFPIIPSYIRHGTIKPYPRFITWATAELAYSVYIRHGGSGQSLEMVAERGGFGATEMDKFLPDWRERELAMRAWSVAIRALDSYHELGQGTCQCPGHKRVELLRKSLPVFEDPT